MGENEPMTTTSSSGHHHDHPDVDTATLRRAEDGSEILYALATHLNAYGSTRYAEQVSNAAHAVRQITARHPAADPAPENDPRGAGEHAGEIGRRLELSRYLGRD